MYKTSINEALAEHERKIAMVNEQKAKMKTHTLEAVSMGEEAQHDVRRHSSLYRSALTDRLSALLYSTRQQEHTQFGLQGG